MAFVSIYIYILKKKQNKQLNSLTYFLTKDAWCKKGLDVVDRLPLYYCVSKTNLENICLILLFQAPALKRCSTLAIWC